MWEHIIGGKTEPKLGGVWNYGTKLFGDLLLRYVNEQHTSDIKRNLYFRSQSYNFLL